MVILSEELVLRFFPLQESSSSEVSFWFVSSPVELDVSEVPELGDDVEFEGPEVIILSGIEFVRPTSSSIVVRHTIVIFTS